MSKRPVVIYDRIAILSKKLATPDRRFKSGYRDIKEVANTSFYFTEGIDSTTFTLSRIDKMGDKYEKTDAVAEISFKLQDYKQVI